MTWECIERPAKLFFAYHTFQGTTEFKDWWGVPFPKLHCGFSRESCLWCWNQEELTAAGERLFNHFRRNPELGRQMRKKWFQNAGNAQALFKELERKRIEELSNEELCFFMEKMQLILASILSISLVWDIFDITLETTIKTELAKSLDPQASPKEFHKAFVALTTPPEESFAKTEERELLKIAVEIQKKAGSKGILSQGARAEKGLERFPDIEKKVSGHLKKFSWIRAGYSSGRRMTRREVLERLGEAIRKSMKPEKPKSGAGILRQKKLFLKRLKASKELGLAIRIINELGFLHDSKKEIQMRYFCHAEEILLEAAKGLAVPKDLVFLFLPGELVAALQTGKFDSAELKRRAQHAVLQSVKPDRILSGKKALSFEQKALQRKAVSLEELREVSGVSASPGTAVGRARVIKSQKELDQMREGEILVTGMTTPDFVPAMKKAAGIITDEGGVLCHAAIVSRELRLPCVVGTKTATKVFRTGEMIEVRANHGVARKISEAR